MATKKTTSEPAPKNRNLGIRRVRVADIEDAPWNFRTHPEGQAKALGDVVDELGWYGYPDVYETADGLLRLCDGHLRKKILLDKYGLEAEIEVNITNFDEHEAKKATLTKDPLAAMAEVDAEQLDALLREVQTESEAIGGMLEEMAKSAGIVPEEGPAADQSGLLKEKYQILIDCESETQQAELLERFQGEGIECRSLMS